MDRDKNRLRILGALVGIGVTICTVIAAELILRAVLPGNSRYLVHLAHTRQAFAPLPQYVPGVRDTAWFITNSYGIRGPEFGPDSSEYRVLAVGGSTTECAMLDEPESWPAILRTAMPRARDGRSVWVGNAGRSGLTSRDHVVEMKFFLPELPHIDLVVLLVGINDLTSALKQGNHYQAPPAVTDPDAERLQVSRAFAAVPGPFHRPGSEFLLAHDAAWYKATALWQLAKRVRIRASSSSLVQDPAGKNYELWRSHRRTAPTILDTLPDLSAALSDYARNLNAIVDHADQQKVRLVLLTQPTLWSASITDSAKALLWMGGTGDFQSNAGETYFTARALRQGLDLYNKEVLKVCTERHVECVDLGAEVPSDARWFYDDVHFTEDGSRLVAQLIAPRLASVDSMLPSPQFDAPVHP